MNGVRLRVALLWFRRRHFGALLALGLVAAIFVVGVAVVRDSAVAAIDRSAHADQGFARFVIQTGDLSAARALAAEDGVVPVVIESGNARADDLFSPALIRTVGTGLPFGDIVNGRHATASGEATITSAISVDLNVTVGDRLSLFYGDGDHIVVRVVGITVFPAERTRRGVTTVNPSIPPEHVTTWLGDINPDSIAALRPFLDDRTASYRSVDSLAADAIANQPKEIALLRHVPQALVVLMMGVILTATALMVPVARSDVDSLIATGMSSGRSWGLYTRMGFGAVFVGQLLGSGLVVAGVHLARGSISSAFGQEWTALRVPTALLVLFPTVTMVLGTSVDRLTIRLRALALRVIAAMHYPDPRDRRTRFPLGGLVVLALGIALTVYALREAFRSVPSSGSRLALPGVVLVAASIPLIVRFFSAAGLGPGGQAVVSRISSKFATIAFAAVLVAAITGAYAATTYRDANLLEREAHLPQPPGSFVIQAVPVSAVETLWAAYRAEGGSEMVEYQLVQQGGSLLRVTGPRLLECMRATGAINPEAVDADCFPQDTRSPINTVALNVDGREILADPGLIEGGRVGLMAIDPRSGRVSSTSEVSAEPSDILGGILPGLVVPADGPVTREYRVRATNRSVVALLDFAALSPASQSRVRNAVAGLAPASLTADASIASGYDRERALANAVAIIGATLVLLIMVLGGASVTLGHERTRRTLVDMGATFTFRNNLVLRWSAIASISYLLCIPLVLLGAEIVGRGESASYGLVWLMPFVVGVLSVAAIHAFFLKVPDRARE